LLNQAKREAQEALFTAIKDQAENNMHAAMRPSEKAQLLRSLAEAYRSPQAARFRAPATDRESPRRSPRATATPPADG